MRSLPALAPPRALALFVLALLCCPACEAELSGRRLDREVPPGDSGLTDRWIPPADGWELDDQRIDPAADRDGDRLPDGFEALFDSLDPTAADSDGDGVPDAEEDEDGDGLSALQEWAAWSLAPVQGQRASPEHKDLLVELDAQQDQAPSEAVLQQAIAAFAALPLENLDGAPGIALHVYRDELNLPVAPMPEPLAERLAYLGAHGPSFASSPPHVAQMVHVLFASDRPDNAARGGDTVGASDEPPEKAGVLIYSGNLAQIFPVCAEPGAAAVSLEEGLASTLVHELGHTLQLGHDTEAGGGINPYNIMSTDLGECELLRKRTRGTGNLDAALGATEQSGGPRFSREAAALIKLKSKISVEANGFEVEGGSQM